MPKKDSHTEDFEQDWDSMPEDDESNEFERRQQGAKRESAKRARSAEKELREEREAEFASNVRTDKRAQQKNLKRRVTELKRVADQLNIKGALQEINNDSQMTAWGPDVISNKNRPSLAVVLNFIPDTSSAHEVTPTPELFGAWLYYLNNQVTIAVATKASGETDSHSEQANPPSRNERIFEITYNDMQSDTIRERISQIMRSQGPIK